MDPRNIDASMDYSPDQVRHIATLFCIPEPFDIADFPEKGNINRRAYLIRCGHPGSRKEYILQKLNLEVLTQPGQLMRSIMATIRAQRSALSRGIPYSAKDWKVLTIIPTRAGDDYLEIQGRAGLECWRMMVRIPNCRSYKSLHQIPDPRRRLKMAEQAGRGLALFLALTGAAECDQMTPSVPGYRDTRLYYDQLFSVLKESRHPDDAAPFLPADSNLRRHTEPFFFVGLSTREYQRRMGDNDIQRCIQLALEQRRLALSLYSDYQAGLLQKTVIHGDTKLENFLFEIGTDEVRSLIDLDTLMPYTWLADWGDMARSLINRSGENTSAPDSVQTDMEVFEAAARGFLRSSRRDCGREQLRMAEAVQVMTLELGVRFLSDYLRGDNYFKLDPSQPPDLNKVRALVQFTLFERIRDNYGQAAHIIESLCREQATPSRKPEVDPERPENDIV